MVLDAAASKNESFTKTNESRFSKFNKLTFMKISIGTKIKNSAWGGGNSFAKHLSNYLREKGIDVFFDLKEKDISRSSI